MESRLNLDTLAGKLKRGETEGLADTHFPTLDLDNPTRLTDEEREVIDDLARQFTSSRRIRELMRFLFDHGCLYHINNYILNIHALIPSTAEGEFDEFLGRRGRDLFDHLETVVKNVGHNYLNDDQQNPKELALMFYLWCGPKSPFFGKNAMKTFERYFYTDKATHKEKTLYWGGQPENADFMDRIMQEFDCRRIVYGLPVDIMKGEKIASPTAARSTSTGASRTRTLSAATPHPHAAGALRDHPSHAGGDQRGQAAEQAGPDHDREYRRIRAADQSQKYLPGTGAY
jgi:fructose-1,6-bisphosphatase-3